MPIPRLFAQNLEPRTTNYERQHLERRTSNANAEPRTPNLERYGS